MVYKMMICEKCKCKTYAIWITKEYKKICFHCKNKEREEYNLKNKHNITQQSKE